MTALQAALPLPWRPGRIALLVGGGLSFVGLVALRAAGLHTGLLYPDGYQYLLMARGIAEHLEPVATLGQGGDVLGPSSDAAAKPLFPAIVALLSALGVSPLAAARAVTVVAGAAVPVLTGLVALRLRTGRGPAFVAALLCVSSPTLAYWYGFAGPDPLAPALALGAALALLHRYPVAGGMLAGLCVLARPEYALVAGAAAIVGIAVRTTRREALQATAAGSLVVAALLALVRPPVGLPEPEALGGVLLLVGVAACVLLVAGRVGPLGATCLAAAVILPFALLDGGAWASLGRQDWALLTLAGAGFVLCLSSPGARSTALRIVALSLPLGVAYWVKNPGLARYVAQLVPELALVAALGLGTLRRGRVLATTAAAGILAVGAVAATQPIVGTDAFQELAPALARTPAGPLVTAAPDAYGVLLDDRPIRVMRPGMEGLVLVDAAARAYEPGLRAEGTVVARIPVTTGFLRPDGTIDRAPALLYRGRVVRR